MHIPFHILFCYDLSLDIEYSSPCAVSRFLLFTHLIYNSLHLLIPNSHSMPPPPPLVVLYTYKLFFFNLLLSKRQVKYFFFTYLFLTKIYPTLGGRIMVMFSSSYAFMTIPTNLLV